MPPRKGDNVFQENEKLRRKINFLENENLDLHHEIVSLNRVIEGLKLEMVGLNEKIERNKMKIEIEEGVFFDPSMPFFTFRKQ
jgi:predicted  nucleic acid-binding Zn-ribbon protein